MQKKEYLIIPNKKELDLYTKYNFDTFILPLEGYSIGFNVYYDVDEINNYVKNATVASSLIQKYDYYKYIQK